MVAVADSEQEVWLMSAGLLRRAELASGSILAGSLASIWKACKVLCRS